VSIDPSWLEAIRFGIDVVIIFLFIRGDLVAGILYRKQEDRADRATAAADKTAATLEKMVERMRATRRSGDGEAGGSDEAA
jgi:hypothetical protein